MAKQVKTKIKVQRDKRNRVTVFFRGILIFPVFVYVCTLTQAFHWGISSSVITIPVILALVFRGKYPSYILAFNHALLELSLRLIVYGLFLTDEYPSIEKNENFTVQFPEVEDGRKLSRWQPIFKIIFAIPLIIVGIIYTIIAAIFTLFAWLHILVFAKYPDPLIDFVVGTIKYWNRVIGYAGVLVTDEYPSFKLD
jgi:Domain of unknown function (DUF4389)